MFQYNTNQSKKAASQAISSPSATTPPSTQSTPSSGTPSLSSGTVPSPVPAPSASSSLAALEAQRQKLLELQEKAKQQIFETQGVATQNSTLQSNIAVSLTQLALPPAFTAPQFPLSQTKNSSPVVQVPTVQSIQNATQSSGSFMLPLQIPAPEVQSTTVADDDAPYDPEEDLDLALEDAMAKENDKEKTEQTTSLPVAIDTRIPAASSVTVPASTNSDSLKDAFPRLQATLHALGIPAVAQRSTVSKQASEPEEKKKIDETVVSSRTDSHAVTQPSRQTSLEHKEMQNAPQVSSTSRHHFTESPAVSHQVSGMRQNPSGLEPSRMEVSSTETRHSKENNSSQGVVTSREQTHHESRMREEHHPTGHPEGRSDVQHRPDHMGGRSHNDRPDTRHPHEVRPRDPSNSWRDPRGLRDSRNPHEARYNRDRDPHDLGYSRDRYRGRHEEGQYRDYPDRYRGRDGFGQDGGYPRGDQPRRRSWEDPRYEGYRRERWRR